MGLIRHPSLQPLSRQHRDWLVQAHELRDATRSAEATAAEVVRRFLAFWERCGEAHLRYEENQLVACYAKFCDVQRDEAIGTMLRQHTQIRRLIEQLTEHVANQRDPTALIPPPACQPKAGQNPEERFAKWSAGGRPRQVVGIMVELGTLLEAHIRHEERVVFAQIQDRVPESELLALPTLS